jgi:hypothetical protein
LTASKTLAEPTKLMINWIYYENKTYFHAFVAPPRGMVIFKKIFAILNIAKINVFIFFTKKVSTDSSREPMLTIFLLINLLSVLPSPK